MANEGKPSSAPDTRASLLAKITGATVLAAGAMLYGNGTSQVQTLPAGTAGYVMVSAGAAAPVWTNIYGQANVWTAAQTIDRGTGALPASSNAAANLLRLANADSVVSYIESFGFSSAALNVRARHASGTRASPSATLDAQVIAQYTTGSYDGTTWKSDIAAYRVVSDGLHSGANCGVYHAWIGTPSGSITAAEWMRLQNAALAIGGNSPTAGNGLLQFASGTTKANGAAFGNWNMFRVGDTDFNIQPTTGVDGYVRIVRSSGETLALGAASGVCVVRAASAHPLWLGANGGTNLHVKNNGQVRFVPLSADPAGAETGDVYYNSTTNKLRVYNGAWVDLH